MYGSCMPNPTINQELMRSELLVIVDDEEDILELLQYNFRTKGYKVAAFNRVKPAMDFIRRQKPSAILCDWMMPEKDGLDFCRDLKNDTELSSIPFVMVTCKSEKTAIAQAMDEGVSDYVVKPVRILDLIIRVEDLLSGRKAAFSK